MVVQEYRDQHDGKAPSELFLHAKSNFIDEEWHGFVSGAPSETNVVGVQIFDAKDALKLMTRPLGDSVILAPPLISEMEHIDFAMEAYANFCRNPRMAN